MDSFGYKKNRFIYTLFSRLHPSCNLLSYKRGSLEVIWSEIEPIRFS